ncbi:protein hemingway-like [Rhagoletis pomonella]|uniref:protein hemingway-like n=1 Tax=Rhagoletis pomonella TaxID=28610 RepID=UPI00177BD499|nr:protein hemingway-like [Rhagoletis pomonella]
MSNELNSDEEKYANESFENDTDEIPEISETESESEGEPAVVSSNSNLYAYARNRFNGRKNSLQNKNYVPFDSSSEDDQDVVISETIAEINTEPMCMEDAIQTQRTPINSALTRRGSESLATVEIPNFPSYASDGGIIDEVSDSDETKAQLSLENESELLQKFNDLNCGKDELSAAVQLEDEVLAASSFLQPDVAYEEESVNESQRASMNDQNTPLVDTCRQDLVSFSDTDNFSEYPSKEMDNEPVEYEPSIEVHISSETPTSFNSDDYAFHLNFLKSNGSNEQLRMRHQQRKSWSFSNDRMREIERHNHILLRKILSQKPTYHWATPKPTKFTTLPPTTRITSAAINRKKKQRQIDMDNQGLKRRIEAISLRRPTVQHLN